MATNTGSCGGGGGEEVEPVLRPDNPNLSSAASIEYVDIGINICNKLLLSDWRRIVRRAVDAKVSKILLTGTNIEISRNSLAIAKNHLEESEGSACKTLYCTVGVHPHHAETFSEASIVEIRALVTSNPEFVVAIGETGLDFFRKLCPHDKQKIAFREQVKLACELNKPLFVHERSAHEELVKILDEIRQFLPLTPICIHCFTGNLMEARAYIDRGFFIGFTGTICMEKRGKELRDLISSIPLDKIMIETDSPYMCIHPTRRCSEPADVLFVAQTLAECLNLPVDRIAAVTTTNAKAFFNIP